MLNGHLSLMTVKNVLNVKWESARRRIQPQEKALVGTFSVIVKTSRTSI